MANEIELGTCRLSSVPHKKSFHCLDSWKFDSASRLNSLSSETKKLCDTTMTPRNPPHFCNCATRTDQMGPCDHWEVGDNTRCVYCDHEERCHGVNNPHFLQPITAVPASSPAAQNEHGSNYVANHEVRPTEVRFDNGRRVYINTDSDGPFLEVEMMKPGESWLRNAAEAEDRAGFIGAGDTPYNRAVHAIVEAATPSNPPSPKTQEWRTIESCPKDGTTVIFWHGASGLRDRVVVGAYDTKSAYPWRFLNNPFPLSTHTHDGDGDGMANSFTSAPTHWMPLPPTPKGNPND